MWFIPGSALTQEQLRSMPTQVATRMPAAYLRVAKKLGQNQAQPIYNIQDFVYNKSQLLAIDAIGSLFAKYGSDKSVMHNYHLIYGSILSSFENPPKILEIGLGSNNTEIASNMGAQGRPGASLRAFQEFLPNSIVHGADIDNTITVDQCTIFHIDQTDPGTFAKIKEGGESRYDLIIDDGLHSPDANLFTLEFGLGCISDHGFIVIEDIIESALPIWQSLQLYFLFSCFRSYLIKTKSAYVFICTKSSFMPGMI